MNAKDRNDFEQYLLNDKNLIVYNGPTKQVTQFPITRVGERIAFTSIIGTRVTMPRLGFQVLDIIHNFDAAEAKKRFTFQLCPRTGDKNYVYVTITPVANRDRMGRFAEIQLALYSPQVPKPYTPYLPAEVRVKHVDGDIEEWKFTEQRLGVTFKKDAFEHKMPEGDGWKLEKVPQVAKEMP